jgi:hypothetical protein
MRLNVPPRHALDRVALVAGGTPGPLPDSGRDVADRGAGRR